MKRFVWGLLAAVLLCAGCAGGTEQKVYVAKVGTLLGLEDSAGLVNRYSGVIETLESADVQKDDTKTVKEVFVAVGDTVQAGDPLFSYDVDAMELALEKQRLELENLKNSILTMKNQVTTLEKQLEKAKKEADILDYTLQIQTLQLQIMEAEYNQSSKELEIARAEAALENTVVVSPMTGTIQSIRSENGDQAAYYYYGAEQTNAYITITDTTHFRVKCKVAEQHVSLLNPGMPMVIRSRVDDTLWTGTLESIDFTPEENNNNGMYYGGDMGNTASRYPFYVTLDDRTGLILGQHVTVEPELPDSGEGVWLPEAYLLWEEGGSYVWLDRNGKIARVQVELGAYDAMACRWQVLSGLTLEDALAFPEEWITEGIATTFVASQQNSGQEPAEGGLPYEEPGYEEPMNYNSGDMPAFEALPEEDIREEKG